MLKETDLHVPVKDWLEGQGCKVRSEVKSIDMVGLYDESTLIAVEMKLKLNLEVINQAVERQGYVDAVYIAVVHDFKAFASKRFNATLLTLKRLNIGLLVVNFRSTEPYCYEVLKPESFDFERSRKAKKNRRATLVKEFNRRSGDFNRAGSKSEKLMTAYREECLLIAHFMSSEGLSRANEFQFLGMKTQKASGILSKNFHGWFEKVDKGIYKLSAEGHAALSSSKSIVDFILSEREGTSHD
ncbi:MAG: hypothetical protein BGO41_08905 [Clostridiales bacterium 38-18]|nr:MAG: hypothetical protein BGO41_08905 [Clostridiales bacterium 38-18]